MSAKIIPISTGEVPRPIAVQGLRDCTIRNDAAAIAAYLVGHQECYLELDPGEQVTIRSVEA